MTVIRSQNHRYFDQYDRCITKMTNISDQNDRKPFGLSSKCITPIKVNAIVDDHGFKTTAMLLFKKTMLLLTNIANQNPELLKNIPEFLCQNINDVTGLLR